MPISYNCYSLEVLSVKWEALIKHVKSVDWDIEKVDNF